MPRAIVTVRELKNKDTGLDISIPTYTETPGLFANTIEFQVVVVTNLRCFKTPEHDDHDVVQFMMKKSQSELEQFYAKLERNYPGTVLPALPRKSFLTEVPAMELKIAFEKFLQFLAMSSKLCICPVLLQFFGSDPMKAGRFSRENSRQEAVDSIDIFEEARHDKNPSPNESTKPRMTSRPSIFDEDENDDSGQSPEDLFAPPPGVEDEFDLLSLAKAADKEARKGRDGELSEETGEREKEQTETKTTPVSDNLKLFEDCDYGGAVNKNDESLFILPGSTSMDADLSKLDMEDHSDLLNINDDVDSLFQKPKQQPTKPPKPATKPRPAVKPKPPTKPKPGLKPKPAVKSKPEIDGSDDIMKYIRENTVDNEDVDLFS